MRQRIPELCVFLLLLVPLEAMSESVLVASVDFTGLKNVNKFELAERAHITVRDNGILVNVDALKKALSAEKLIKNFQVKRVQNRLVVTVTEHTIAFCIAVILPNGKTYIVETDDEFNILSLNRVHDLSKPVIFINEKRNFSGHFLRDTTNVLCRIREIERHGIAVVKEVSAIDVRNGTSVMLRGAADNVCAPA